MAGKDIEKDIKEHSFHSVYLIYGEEGYLVRKYRELLKNAVLGSEDEMNYSYFQGKGIDLAEVRDIGSTLPFFSDYRFLFMEETGFCKTASDVTEILEGLPESTIVLFVEKEVDKRNKLYKYIAKNGLVSEMKAMSEKETLQFIAAELGKGKKRIKESTAKYLYGQVNSSLFNLRNELQKLIAYSGDRVEVTQEDIDAICCKEVTDHMFQMLDAVAEGDSRRTLHFYRELLVLQEEPLKILNLLFRHCNILLQIKTEQGSFSFDELARKIGIKSYFLNKYASQAKRFTLEQIREMLAACVQTDFDFKRGKISDRIGLELLLVSFSEGRKKTPA
ncbi:MAG: DNA polymerase III subunit delta [Lachnospiraceae bacterium]|nr:DNA polymerase III subunit delta [Lachnospiraceae bacterium]